MAIATVSDFEDFLGRSLSDAEMQQAYILLDTAHAAVRRWAKQYIEEVSGDVVTLRGNWGHTLELPERPVSAVTTVLVDGTATTDYDWDGKQTLYRGSSNDNSDPWAPVDRSEFHWGGPSTIVTVTYTHGYAAADILDVKGVILAMASRGLAAPAGVQSESMGQYSVTYAASAHSAGVMLPQERSMLKWLKR